MSIVNIIIFTEAPLSKRDYDRFGVEILSGYFNVHIFDCTSWLIPEYWKKLSHVRHVVSDYNIINDYDDFKRSIKGFEKTIAIDYLGYCNSAKSIRLVLQELNIPRAVVRCGLNPTPEGLSKLKRISGQGNIPHKIFNKLYWMILEIVSPKILPIDIALLSGKTALNENHIKNSLNKIWAHSFDYELYLKYKNGNENNIKPYAVFLDSDLVFHPEYMVTGEKPLVTIESFYPSINKFFDRFEYVTGLQVIIAAHPRSRYDLRPTLYGNRVPLMGQTAELVRDSSLLMTIQSTAVSYGVLWQKPIVFINSDEFEKSDHKIYMENFADELKTKIINVDSYEDSELDHNVLKNFDKVAYQNYKNKYIKTPNSDELPIWEIFSQYIKANFHLN